MFLYLKLIDSGTNLEGSGVAVKKCMQGRLVSLGRTDTMLPVVQKCPESMQMPLGLSLRMDIITSAVSEPETTKQRTHLNHIYHEPPQQRSTLTVMLLE